MIKDNIQSVMWTVYANKGWDSLYNCAWDLMRHCEKNAGEQKYRQMKGEIAEVVLDCGLREIQESIKPSAVLKGLCIPLRSSKTATNNKSISVVTKYKMYMFECKSYKNRPVVTAECMLGDSMNVYEQSRYHMKALHEYIGRLCVTNGKSKPYKLILFEMSSDGVDDQRTDENKARIPILNPSNFREYLMNDFKEHGTEEIWDVDGVHKVLLPLASKSDEMFKRHLARMINKKG